jgi:hypothetical protein
MNAVALHIAHEGGVGRGGQVVDGDGWMREWLCSLYDSVFEIISLVDDDIYKTG